MSTFSKGLFKTTSGGGGLTPEVQEALDTKANKATSLAGYGITDAYTKTQSDGKYATTAQGAKADTAVQPAAIADMLTKTEAGTTYAKTSSLATVATSGSYNDLTDKPDAYSLPKASTTVLGGVKVDGTTITSNAEGVITAVGGGGTGGTTDYTDLTNKPQINSVELTGNKTLAALGIQAAGDYALTSAIPTKVSQLQNDSNFLTSVPAEYVTETELSAKNYATTEALTSGLATKANTEDLATVATTGSYNDLTDKPAEYSLPKASTTVLGGVKVDGTTITANAEGVITAVGGGTGGTTDYTALTNKPQINSIELTGNKSLAALGIQAAGDYALASAVPTKVSQLENDSNFLTGIPSEYVTETELSAKGYATNSELTSGLATKANTADLATVATSGSYNDLTNKPAAYTLPTASDSTLGGVKVDGTTITATPEGVISATGSTVPENVVTTNTEQTISAAKTFSSDILIENNTFGIKAKYGGNLVGTWSGLGAQFGNTTLATKILSSSVPTVTVGAATSKMALFVTAANKDALPEATSSANMFGFLTETSTLVFCDGTAWKQITLTDLA